jgi:cysteine-rich repeat protein
VCGDGRITGDEECDDGSTANGNGCSATCQYEIGTCSVNFFPVSGIIPLNGSYTVTANSFFTNGTIDF